MAGISSGGRVIRATRPREKAAVSVTETPEGVQIGLGTGIRFLLTEADAYALCDAVTDALEGSE